MRWGVYKAQNSNLTIMPKSKPKFMGHVIVFKWKGREEGGKHCSTLTVARLPGATKNFIRAGKFSRVVARSGNNELHRLLHFNSPPTLVVNMFNTTKYHNTIVAKIAMLKIRVLLTINWQCSPILNATFYCVQVYKQKLSNLAFSIKQRTGCENGTMWLSVKQSKVDLVNRSSKNKSRLPKV